MMWLSILFHWHAHQGFGYTYHCNREYEKAINELETAISMQPHFKTSRTYLNHSLLKQSHRLYRQGKDEEAEVNLDKIYEYFPDLPEEQTLINMAIRGQEEQVIGWLNDFTFVAPSKKMHLMLLLGRDDEALSLIDQLISFDAAVFVNPIFDPARDDPRFEQIVERKLGIDVDTH